MNTRIRRRPRREASNTPMAPMIDMVFLLLVFFMTASAMSQDGGRVELELPESPSSQVSEDLSNRVIVSVDDAGSVFWGTEEVELNVLGERLETSRNEQPTLKLRIRASRTAPFGTVRRVMATAAEVGVESYLYATFQSGGGSE